MGYSVKPMNMREKRQYAFWTIERDPSSVASVGKQKVLDFLRSNFKFARDASGKQMCMVVAEKGGKTSYDHYHAIMKTEKPVHFKRIAKKMQRHMKFKKPNSKEISVWVGQANQHQDNVWQVWEDYVGWIDASEVPGGGHAGNPACAGKPRLHAKGKEFDQDMPLVLEDEPIYEEYRAYFEQRFGPDRYKWPCVSYVSAIDGVTRSPLTFM